MKTIEYRTADKSQWGAGPWHQEPDKIQWRDEATGLPCLMVRNHGGAWCGYVGVSEGHPLFGTDYSGKAKLPKDRLRTLLEARGVGELYADDLEKGEVRIDAILDAHGGITFAHDCGEHTREAWEKWCQRRKAAELEAIKYPVGDSARFLREWSACFDSYEAWVERCQAVGVCHLPEAGEPDKVWWFGFDCAHAGDVCPGYESMPRFGDDSYKDVEYVKGEVASLARQIASL